MERRPDWTIPIVIGVLLSLVVAKLVYSAIVYDDWTCAFARCVKVSERR